MKTKDRINRHLKNSVNRSLLIQLLLSCFALMPMAQAVGPDTEGAIPGSNNGEGIGVLVNRTTGVWNAGTGFEALKQLTAGNQNTATGFRALFSDTNGGFNTATGVYSLFSNTSGSFNNAVGAYTLANNISGSNNTATGYAALYRNTAEDNTATGFTALYRNTTGDRNTANGAFALFNNTTGTSNTGDGLASALSEYNLFLKYSQWSPRRCFPTQPDSKTRLWAVLRYKTTQRAMTDGHRVFAALNNNTTGASNTANGTGALVNSTGDLNVALGFAAGRKTCYRQ